MIRSNALSDERSEESHVRQAQCDPERQSNGSKDRYFVYILRTSSDTLYIGQTNNLEKRTKEHQNKSSKSASYIKYFDSFQLVYSEEYPSRIEAMKREWQLKKWTKVKKEALISDKLDLLKML